MFITNNKHREELTHSCWGQGAGCRVHVTGCRCRVHVTGCRCRVQI